MLSPNVIVNIHISLWQASGLVPIVEPEVLLDGEHGIDRTLEVAEAIWAETFKYMADQKVMFEGILLKPSMVRTGPAPTATMPCTYGDSLLIRIYRAHQPVCLTMQICRSHQEQTAQRKRPLKWSLITHSSS